MADCVQCGFCCMKAPCGFGAWDGKERSDGNHPCIYLVPLDDKGVRYGCGKYESISQTPGSEFSPAFGAGCCMSLFNTRRQQALRQK